MRLIFFLKTCEFRLGTVSPPPLGWSVFWDRNISHPAGPDRG
ncbi:hypothetical protein B4135_2448 [Caldibacillus debilis]|uniref:Uncharacterized protein n=1 Tax=Caldibacillus debilis TaxID=301148 RepID=A0A150LZ74_9BACI|nr:hypothetical protein B4135_2448 [Caldibacillus debilis]